MILRSAAPLVSALAALLFAAPAAAQSMCGERNRVVDQFRKEFHEAPAAVGLVSEDTLLELLTSEKGTWTIIITRPDGASCLMASGVAWEAVGSNAGYLPLGGRTLGLGGAKRLIVAKPADAN